MITVRMTQEEYERFLEFRGAEKQVTSIRTQDKIFRKKAEDLSHAVCDALDVCVNGDGVLLYDNHAALRALTLAADILS